MDCKQEAQDEKNAYIVDTSIRALIKEEVNTQLPQILPQAVLDFANHVIEKNVTESVEAAILTRSTSQPTSTYEAVASLSEFELTKILIDKMEKNKSYDRADYKKKLYDALVESYNTGKYEATTLLFEFELIKILIDKMEKNKSKEKKSSRTSKDASKSQHKSSGKSAHAEEPSHTVEDSGMQQDQEFTWISQVARAEEPPTSFYDLNDTSFDFFVFVMNRLKIPNLTQEILVGPAFNLLKGTCKTITELEYHLEECSKATTERLDWYNPENKSSGISEGWRLKQTILNFCDEDKGRYL
ncbi:hypothetical protein Tco_1039547 [Tanacetum coccineum]